MPFRQGGAEDGRPSSRSAYAIFHRTLLSESKYNKYQTRYLPGSYKKKTFLNFCKTITISQNVEERNPMQCLRIGNDLYTMLAKQVGIVRHHTANHMYKKSNISTM